MATNKIHNEYKKAVKYLKDGYYPNRVLFLCSLLEEINVSPETMNHFKSNQPTPSLHPEFYGGPDWIGGYCWWVSERWGEKDMRKMRINFLKKMIKITKPKRDGNN